MILKSKNNLKHWAENFTEIAKVEPFTAKRFKDFISQVPKNKNLDSYIYSPVYYGFTGRKGAWLYSDSESMLVVLIHPNSDNSLLVYPQISKNCENENFYLLEELLYKMPPPKCQVQLAKVDQSTAQSLYEYLKNKFDVSLPQKEKILDWIFPVYVLSTELVSNLEGKNFQQVRQRINKLKLNQAHIFHEEFNLQKHQEKILCLIRKWSKSYKDQKYTANDLISPTLKMLELLRDVDYNLTGQVIYYYGEIKSFCAWEENGQNYPANEFFLSSDKSVDGLSEFQIFNMCKCLSKKGIKYVNIGGSETTGLDRYKKKFAPAAKHEQMTICINL